MKRALVLGGGFAGIEAAISLKKQRFQVTLVSERSYFYNYPISIWIPTGEMEFEKATIDLAALQEAHGFELIVDRVSSIHGSQRRVELESGKILSDFDYLIIAMGAQKVTLPGMENTLTICGTPDQSKEIQERLRSLVEKKEGRITVGFSGNPKDPSGVRGGPGFELLFNIHNLLKKKGVRDKFSLSFFAPMASPGARMGGKALKLLEGFLNKSGIQAYTGKKIKQFRVDGVVLEDDSRLDSDLTIFIPGVRGHEVFQNSDLPLNDGGFIRINDACQVAWGEGDGSSPIYAIGDSAAIEGPDWKAKQGHIAEVMARVAVANIVARERGLPQREGYRKHLNILCVMDSGDGAIFVFRNDKRAIVIPMPVFGHWLKKSWGYYFRLTKMKKIPRIPGL